MTVYPKTGASTSAWTEPIETIWQNQGSGTALPGQRRADLGLAERLFIGAVMNTPREQREWGIVSWLSQVYRTSRPTLYQIGAWARAQCLAAHPTEPARREAGTPTSVPQMTVGPNRLKRTMLTLSVPGRVSERHMGDCLEVAFDQRRATGSVSALLHEAGQRAGAILERVDLHGLGTVVLARDEIFAGCQPNLLLVEPHTLTIVGLYAAQDREAETLGCALLLAEGHGLHICQLAEDGWIPYAASCRAAGLDIAIQRDVWHAADEAGQVVSELEREALRALAAAEKLEQRLRDKPWQEATFAQWVEQTERAELRLTQSAQMRFWYGCLWDAVELVDWRSGEIRQRAINGWLLGETLAGMQTIDHPRVQKLVRQLREQADDLLSFLDGLPPALERWQTQVREHFPDPAWAAFFQSSVARLWRLEHALRNGQRTFANAARKARHLLDAFIAEDPATQPLADALLTMLEQVVRTSCAAEAINSVLRPFLDSRKESTDQTSRQLFLNLFTLWFNLHKFERGPRAGKSPYQLAGVDLGSEDWLTVLGYPPD